MTFYSTTTAFNVQDLCAVNAKCLEAIKNISLYQSKRNFNKNTKNSDLYWPS